MLIHRSGTEFEDMYWIDLDEIRVIAEETNSLVKKRIIYSNKIIKKSQSCKNIIISSRSLNFNCCFLFLL